MRVRQIFAVAVLSPVLALGGVATATAASPGADNGRQSYGHSQYQGKSQGKNHAQKRVHHKKANHHRKMHRHFKKVRICRVVWGHGYKYRTCFTVFRPYYTPFYWGAYGNAWG